MSAFVDKAKEFAAKAHEGQVDKAGVAYIEHPAAVASMLSGETEKVVAYLHDVVEDTGVSLDTIRHEFGDEVAEAVDKLTRRAGVPYMDYIKALKDNKLARVVKMADLRHNMDLTRLLTVSDVDLKRVQKYAEAYKFLSE